MKPCTVIYDTDEKKKKKKKTKQIFKGDFVFSRILDVRFLNFAQVYKNYFWVHGLCGECFRKLGLGYNFF